MFSGLDAVDVRHGRRWTALMSFTLQGMLVSAAVVLPLLRPSYLPDFKHRIFTPISLGERTIEHTPSNSPPGAVAHSQALVVHTNAFIYPGPHTQNAESDNPVPPNLPPVVGPGDNQGVLSSITSVYVQPVPLPAPAARPPRQSVMMEGNLITRVSPQYPAIARQIRLQGTVVIRAVISREGVIEQATAVTGPGLLAPAALEAVKQWRYRPYYLNGEPVEVETQVTVKFILNQ